MSVLSGDPTYIVNKEQYFMDIAKGIEKGSNHPVVPGACVIVRQRDIISNGRSVLATCNTEIDCITYAIATAAKNGTPLVGSTIYTTCYPRPESIFQLHIIGIKHIIFLFREFPAGYSATYRRSAALASDLGISLEVYDDTDHSKSKTQSSKKERSPEAFQTGTIKRSDIELKEYTTNGYDSDFDI